jgi:hypothetical protein
MTQSGTPFPIVSQDNENKSGANSLRTGKITGTFLTLAGYWFVPFSDVQLKQISDKTYNITKNIFCRSACSSHQHAVLVGWVERSETHRGRCRAEMPKMGSLRSTSPSGNVPPSGGMTQPGVRFPVASQDNENKPGANSLRTGQITGTFFKFLLDTGRFLSATFC